MIFKSTKFSKEKKIFHGFFSRKNGFSKGVYNSLNCGLGSKDNKKKVLQKFAILKEINPKFKNLKIIFLKKDIIQIK